MDLLDIFINDLPTPITEEKEQLEYITKIKAGDKEARDEFIARNLALVIHTVKGMNYNECFNLMDMIQEGSLGLLRAIEKFDNTKGIRFSTYATIWIKSFAERAFRENENTIRVPVNYADKVIDYEKFKNNLASENRFYYSDKQIKKAYINKRDVREVDYENIIRYNHKYIDCDINDIEEVVEDKSFNIEDDYEKKNIKEFLDEWLSIRLTSREKYVIEERYYEEKSLTDVARYMLVTSSRIRQINDKAINKLRTLEDIRDLNDRFFDRKLKDQIDNANKQLRLQAKWRV